ncbi:MAG TPA: cation:proton antiporter [Gemmatimonadaceae bacterium]|nr:cation:proton antiporter [Gemmatimonadaceae bacterium]
MISPDTFFRDLAIVFSVAAATTLLFQWLKQPLVFGYLLAGMIVGPNLLVPLSAHDATVRDLSELGVILLMFAIGLEFRLRRVMATASSSGMAALTETSIMFVLGYVAAQAMGWSTVECLFAGAMLVCSSTTIVTRAFATRASDGKTPSLVLGILIVEDLIAIILIAGLTTVAAGQEMSLGEIGITAARLITFLVALITLGALIVPRAVRAAARSGSGEVLLVVSVGACFAASLAALGMGYSVALGAFIGGSLCAESGQSERIIHLVEPVRDLFVAVFFVSVGMLLDPRVLVAHWPAVLLFTGLVIGGKVLGVTAGAFFTGNGLRPSIEAGMSLTQIGEFSFIVAGIGTAAGVIRPELYAIIVAVSALTTFTTPWFIKAARPAAIAIERRLPRGVQVMAALYASWFESLAERDRTSGGRARIRRLVRRLALDGIFLTVVIVGVATDSTPVAGAITRAWGWPHSAAIGLVMAVGLVLAVPILAQLLRAARRLAFVLSVRALPAPTWQRSLLADAPRRALLGILQAVVLLAVLLPVAAVTQPFVPHAAPIILPLIAVVALTAGAWRTAGGLTAYVRSGGELIIAALEPRRAAGASPTALEQALEDVADELSGLGDLRLATVEGAGPVAGRTLAEVNLRAVTGASAIVILPGDGSRAPIAAPAATTRLYAGDLLVLAGSRDALAAGVALIEHAQIPTAAIQAG